MLMWWVKKLLHWTNMSLREGFRRAVWRNLTDRIKTGLPDAKGIKNEVGQWRDVVAGWEELEVLGRWMGWRGQLTPHRSCSDPAAVPHTVRVSACQGLVATQRKYFCINVGSLFTQHVDLFKFLWGEQVYYSIVILCGELFMFNYSSQEIQTLTMHHLFK